MIFADVVSIFETIERAQGRLEITALLAELFEQADGEEAKFLAYFTLGALYPPYKNKQFNIATKSVAKVCARLFSVPLDQVASDIKRIGDAGLYVHNTLAHSDSVDDTQVSPVDGNIRSMLGAQKDITYIRDSLHAIMEASGAGSQEEKESLLVALLAQCNPHEAKYIVRSVLGKLRMGFSDMTLIDSFSWMEVGDKSLRKELESAYNISADIGRIIYTLKQSGIDGVRALTLEPGIPLRPAAAERLNDSRAIVDKLGACVAQPKLDGFRVQIHIDKRGQEVRISFFSRNLRDMSEMFPDLTQQLINLPVESLICEGEAIAFDRETGSFLPFQETVKRKRKHGINAAINQFPLQLHLFDLLACDGVSYLDFGHSERRAKLLDILRSSEQSGAHNALTVEQGLQQQSLFAESVEEPETGTAHVQESTVSVIDEREITTGDQLADYFEEVMAHGLEGLVVKKTDAPYKAGKRNFSWIKLKREEKGTLDDTVDCVILGYYAGRGRRAHFGIGALLVGIYNPDTEQYQSIAKIGTGLSDQEWRDIKRDCDARAVTQQPEQFVVDPALAPDVWVSPDLVCMVRADEISKSPIHKAADGYALRFPRIMGMRPDKNPEQSTSPAEILSLYQLQESKK